MISLPAMLLIVRLHTSKGGTGGMGVGVIPCMDVYPLGCLFCINELSMNTPSQLPEFKTCFLNFIVLALPKCID